MRYDHQSRLRHEIEASLSVHHRALRLRSLAIVRKEVRLTVVEREEENERILDGLAHLQCATVLDLVLRNALHLKTLYLGIDVGFRLLMDLDLALTELESLTLPMTKDLWILGCSSLRILSLHNVDCECGVPNFAPVPKLPYLERLSVDFAEISKQVHARHTRALADLDELDRLRELRLYATVMQTSPLIFNGRGAASLQSVLVDGPFIFDVAQEFSQFLARFEGSRGLCLSLRNVHLAPEPHVAVPLFAHVVGLELVDVDVTLFPAFPPTLESLCVRSAHGLHVGTAIRHWLSTDSCRHLHVESASVLSIDAAFIDALSGSALVCLRLAGPKHLTTVEAWAKLSVACQRLDHVILQGPLVFDSPCLGRGRRRRIGTDHMYLSPSHRDWHAFPPDHQSPILRAFLTAADPRSQLTLTRDDGSPRTQRPILRGDAVGGVHMSENRRPDKAIPRGDGVTRVR